LVKTSLVAQGIKAMKSLNDGGGKERESVSTQEPRGGEKQGRGRGRTREDLRGGESEIVMPKEWLQEARPKRLRGMLFKSGLGGKKTETIKKPYRWALALLGFGKGHWGRVKPKRSGEATLPSQKE